VGAHFAESLFWDAVLSVVDTAYALAERDML
jgi:hypothetical protein